MALAVPAASAATVEIRPGGDPEAPVGFGSITVIGFAASPGETNIVSVTATESGYEIADSVATMTAGSGCTLSTPHAVTCSETAVFLVIELGDGNDSVSVDFVEYGIVVRAGDGDDTVAGGDSFTERIYGGPGNDTLRGGRESDIIDGGPGADVMSGGTSWHTHANSHIAHPDVVTYAGRTAPVRADLDGLADDGEQGEGDRILGDFEILQGGRDADVLAGGRRGDRLSGGRGDDRLLGNGGGDILAGGPGFDWLAGGPGRDTLLSRDGKRDVVRGGAGRDEAKVDRVDAVLGVERIVSRAFF